jgi:hypothetical protein
VAVAIATANVFSAIRICSTAKAVDLKANENPKIDGDRSFNQETRS